MRRSISIAVLFLAVILTGCGSSYMATSWSAAGDAGDLNSPTGWSSHTLAGQSDDLADPAPTDQVADQNSATGICYVKAAAIPSQFETMQVLKRPERRGPSGATVVPAQYVTVKVPSGEFVGFEWKPAVCDESLDSRLVSQIQEALINQGYDIGAVDGIAGPATSAGLEYFKRDYGFFGEGMTHEVLQALGIDPSTGTTAFAGI